MKYEEIVDKIRSVYENADARQIFEHIAIQINIVGEGEGILYVEVADRQISVEPYDYHDRDGLAICSGETIFRVANGEMSFKQAIDNGDIHFEGNTEKLKTLCEKVVVRKRKTSRKKA